MHTVTNPDHILYVDDEEALLDIGCTFLERTGGITVDVTTSPIEALRMILSGRYAAVVSDYQMPEMDGIALLKRVREAGSRVPFIIFTGRGREEVAIEALNSGADFYIQKGGDPKAQFVELANAVRQLSGRRKAEAALHRSEEMLYKAQSLAHLGSWELGYGTGDLIWSDETYRIFGLDPGEPMTYDRFLAAIHPDDRRLVDAAYRTSVTDGKDGYEVEHRILRGDSKVVRYVLERCEHHRNGTGVIVRSVGMVHDITERKLAELERVQRHEELQAAYEQLTAAEEELRSSFDDLAENQHRLLESERKLADIIDFLPDATFVIDTSGRVIAWNRAIEEMLGVPKAGMLGRGDYAYAVPLYGEARPVLIDYVLRSDEEMSGPYHAMVREGEILEGETYLPRPDGSRSVIMVRASPLYDREGRRVGAIETIRDITESKALEQEIEYHAGELARQTNSLAVVNRKLNLMSSITRHDILNQLTILLGNLSFAEEAVQEPGVSKYLDRVQGAADRIHRQIEFTRAYTDLGVRSPEWQRIDDTLRLEVLQGLPVENEAGDLVIYADPMLSTVFANLMDNTVRHSETATRVRVWYRLEEGGKITLVWEDNGVGIPAGEKEWIFRRGVGKNTGLGLFLIREILAITGTSIAETGEPGKGARFEMLVPPGAYEILE